MMEYSDSRYEQITEATSLDNLSFELLNPK